MKRLLSIFLLLLFLLTSFGITYHSHFHNFISYEEHNCLVCLAVGLLNNLVFNYHNFVFLIVFLIILQHHSFKFLHKIFISLTLSRAPPV
ncbi:MAG: hypothetical protein ACK4WJ_05320 [Endomicrobiia bacterium]